jgi:hypothetical protein
MKIEYFHASKFGNGAMVAEEFQRQMAATGVQVDIHHIREMPAASVPPADLYLFSSPGRFGKPIRGMRRFLQALDLPAGSRYALLTTEAAPKPDKKTGRTPTEEELVQIGQRVRPVMNAILEGKGLVEVGEDKVYVTKLKGPLEDGWKNKVAVFASLLTDGSAARDSAPGHPPDAAWGGSMVSDTATSPTSTGSED